MFSNVHHKQCIVDNDMQHWQTLLMEQRNTQFQFHASGPAVHVVLRCKQHSLQHPTGKSLMVLGQVILVDTPHFPFALTIFQGNLKFIFVTLTSVDGGDPNSFLQLLNTSVAFSVSRYH
jgi:hypothetical protein